MPITISPDTVSNDFSFVSPGMKLREILIKLNLLEDEVIVIDEKNNKLLLLNAVYQDDSEWKILIVLSRG